VGDVVSEGDVVVEGKIEGNLKVHSLSVQEGAIAGDVDASGNVIVAENSSIDGDIKAERIEVNGKIVGNLQSATKIILNPHSTIEGNVAAATLSMLEGAELSGSISVKKSGGE
jgi:cytoskeletal protein CcmA (bactofilin family)